MPFHNYANMDPDTAAGVYADDLAREDAREEAISERINDQLEDFAMGVDTGMLNHETIDEWLCDYETVSNLIISAWKQGHWHGLGDQIRHALNEHAQDHLERRREDIEQELKDIAEEKKAEAAIARYEDRYA